MADIVYLALLLGFFALCSGFISLCDRIIGPDGSAGGSLDEAPATSTEQVAGTTVDAAEVTA